MNGNVGQESTVFITRDNGKAIYPSDILLAPGRVFGDVERPSLGPIQFRARSLGSRAISEPGVRFPFGTEAVYASFGFEGMAEPDFDFTRIWYVPDGSQVVKRTEPPSKVLMEMFRRGVRNLPAFYDTEGLAPGKYRLELLLGAKVVRSAEFEISGP